MILRTIGLARIKALYRAQLANLSPAGTAASYNRMLYETIKGVLDKGIQSGDFSAELPLEALANHLILAMRGIIYEWCIRYPDFDLQAQARVHFQLILRGMRA